MQQFKKHPYLSLIMLSLFLFLSANQFLAITDSAEANYAQTAKEMLLAGNFLSPQIYGHYWYDKPIFYYWELAASFAFLGFNEFAARLPSAINGTLAILVTYWFTCRVYGRRQAWLAALILLSSVECWLLSKAVITDAALFLFLSLSLIGFYLGYSENRRWYYLAYAASALGVLTKGPIGLFLPGLSALIFLFLRNDIRELRHVHLFSGLLLFACLTLPWYFYMYNQHGTDFLLTFFGVHNFLRAVVAEHASHNVWYFYFLVFFIGFAPWSFTWPYVLYHYKKSHHLPFARTDRCAQLLLIYAAVIFCVFNAIATKYTTYTYPMLFALAILTARAFRPWHLSVTRLVGASFILYTVLAFTVAPALMLKQSGKEIGQTLAEMNTQGKTICYDDDYSTSAVFYSNKMIYLAVPQAKLADIQPGKLNWHAKNVMPMLSEEDILHHPDQFILIDKNHDESFTSLYLASLPYQAKHVVLANKTNIWFTNHQ